MSELSENTFRTKTGICTITPDQIILSREGVRGKVAEAITGNSSIKRILMIYALIGICALAFGISLFLKNDLVTGSLCSLVGIFFLWGVIASRNNSALPIIERSTIREVRATPPHPPATRGYFTVLFTCKGKTRKRLIMLPGSMNNGQKEYERASSVLEQAGLLTIN